MKSFLAITVVVFVAGLLVGSAQPVRAQVPNQPSHVYVSGNQLMVQKRLADGTVDVPRPYVIKGITWQPATRAPAKSPFRQHASASDSRASESL